MEFTDYINKNYDKPVLIRSSDRSSVFSLSDHEGKEYVLKIIDVEDADTAIIDNLISCSECFICTPDHYEINSSKVWLIFKKHDTLNSVLLSGPFPISNILILFKEILEAVISFHKFSNSQMDIKADNILSENGYFMLCDLPYNNDRDFRLEKSLSADILSVIKLFLTMISDGDPESIHNLPDIISDKKSKQLISFKGSHSDNNKDKVKESNTLPISDKLVKTVENIVDLLTDPGVTTGQIYPAVTALQERIDDELSLNNNDYHLTITDPSLSFLEEPTMPLNVRVSKSKKIKKTPSKISAKFIIIWALMLAAGTVLLLSFYKKNNQADVQADIKKIRENDSMNQTQANESTNNTQADDSNEQLREEYINGKKPAAETANTDGSISRTICDLSGKKLNNESMKSDKYIDQIKASTDIYLNDNKLNDLQFISGCDHIFELYISNNNVKDLTFLNDMNTENLTILAASDNELKDLSPLAEAHGLTFLDLSNNPVTDIKPLNGLDKLTFLNLSGCNADRSEIDTYKKEHPDCQVVY